MKHFNSFWPRIYNVTFGSQKNAVILIFSRGLTWWILHKRFQQKTWLQKSETIRPKFSWSMITLPVNNSEAKKSHRVIDFRCLKKKIAVRQTPVVDSKFGLIDRRIVRCNRNFAKCCFFFIACIQYNTLDFFCFLNGFSNFMLYERSCTY